jgi:trehalose-phosphatase
MPPEPGSKTECDTTGMDQIEAVLQSFARELNRGQVLLGLDRDGTLVAIADRPEEAKMDPRVADVVHTVAQRSDVTVAIVSARSNALLQADLPFDNLIFAGNYGLEIRYPDGKENVQEAAAASIPHIHAVRERLAKFTAPGIGAILEDHGYSLCLHWHTVPAESRQSLHDTMRELPELYTDLQFRTLSTSYEVLPQMEWSKGRAMETIARQVNGDRGKIKGFIFIGDSEADEPAFAWVNSKQGVSIKVASAGGSTVSTYQVSDTQDVRRLLMSLCDLPQGGAAALD